MRGYWRRPEATRAAFTEDGYLRTGDIATIDAEGFIRIIDRCKDVIIVSGLNVYPNEVEEVAIQCDGVRECACVGVPDADTDEAVKLYVVRADESLSAEQIYTFCESRLSRLQAATQHCLRRGIAQIRRRQGIAQTTARPLSPRHPQQARCTPGRATLTIMLFCNVQCDRLHQ